MLAHAARNSLNCERFSEAGYHGSKQPRMRNSARQAWRWNVPDAASIDSFQAHRSCRVRGRSRIMSPASRIRSRRNFLVGVPGRYMDGRGDNAWTRCTPPRQWWGTKTDRPLSMLAASALTPKRPQTPPAALRFCKRRGSRQPLATSTLLAPTARCDDLELLSGACNPITALAFDHSQDLPSTQSSTRR